MENKENENIFPTRIGKFKKQYDPNTFYEWSKQIDNPDELLKNIGKDIEVYDSMLNDSHLYALIQSRKSGIISNEWDVDQYESDESIYDFVYSIFNKLDINEAIRNILDAPLFGYQPIEIIWEIIDNKLVPTHLLKRHRANYSFDIDRNLIFTNDSGNEEIVPTEKFLIPSYESSRDNPYGTPLLSKCYWPIVLKNDARKNWTIFIEKYGMPWVKTQYNKNIYSDQKSVDNLLSLIYSMSADAVFAFPSDVELELINGGTVSSAQIYESFMKKCHDDVTEVILGHTAASSSTPGKLGNENMAVDTVDRIIDSDKRLVENTFNQLIKFIVDLNFNTDLYPYFRLVEEEDINMEKAQRDVLLAEKLGIEFTKDYIQREYNLYEEDFEIVKPTSNGVQSPKKPVVPSNLFNILNSDGDVEQNLVDDFGDHVLDPKTNDKLFNKLLKPVFDFGSKGTLEKMSKEYHKLFSKIKTDEFIERMERAYFIIQLHGSHSVDVALPEEKNYFNKEDNLKLKDLVFALDKEPEEIVDYFKSKGVKISKDWKDTFKLVQNHIFTVSGAMKMDILIDFKDMIEKAIAEGLSQSDFKKQLRERFEEKGWLSKTENKKLVESFRLDTIYRTNLQSAFMDGRWAGHNLNIDLAPYVINSSVLDRSTTKNCKALDKKVFRIDDKYFSQHLRPPGHYNCRRITVSLTEQLVKKRGYILSKGVDFAMNKNEQGFDNRNDPWKPEKSKYPKELWNEYEKELA